MLSETVKFFTGDEEYVYLGGIVDQSPFNILLAGITLPNKKYIIPHPPCKQWVFEYVISGKGYIVTEGATYTIEAGDFYILSENVDCYYFSDKNDPLEKVWINLTGNLVRHICRDYGFSNDITVIKFDAMRYFDEMFECLRGEKVDTIGLHLKFHEMIATLGQEDKKQPERTLVESIHDYILSHIDEALNINALADRFFISRAHLSHLFKNKYGQSPYNFYLSAKLETAKELLLETNMQIQEIATRLSFSDSHHFSNSFTRAYGCSPKEFRNNNRDEQQQ